MPPKTIMPDNIPQQCIVHNRVLSEMHEDMKTMKLAICGDDKLEIDGLAKDVKDLKEWRRKLDLRVAGISGGISAFILFVKFVITNK